jgi:hypothetical protein
MFAYDLAPLLRRLLLVLSGLAVAALLVSVAPFPGADLARRLGLVFLLAAPWTIVVACLAVAVRERAWKWAAVTVALLGAAALSLL